MRTSTLTGTNMRPPEVPPGAKKCYACGSIIYKTNKYCPKCGAKQKG